MYPDPNGPVPNQVSHDQSARELLLLRETYNNFHFMIHVLNRLGFIQRDSPRVIKTSALFPSPFTSSWGVIDLAQLEACIKEELSK